MSRTADFDSIYVQTPRGALREATDSHADGFRCDEPAETLGREVMISAQFQDSRAALL
jgi:glyoxalase family protein